MTMNINLKFHPGYQPPEVEGDYYCITTESGMIQTLPYSPKWNRFNIRDCYDDPRGAIFVRWWAPIPASIPVPYGKGMKALTEASRP